MNKAAVIKATEAFVKARLDGEGTGHDWWHIVRVRANARTIMRTEKADAFIVDLALLLHDVGDWKVIHKPKDDYTIAERWLKKCGVPKAVGDEVMSIIRNMSFSASIGKTHDEMGTEFYVAQDADRLDALGAIGIARAFAYGGRMQRPLYDPKKKARMPRTLEEYRKMQVSTIHNFYEKILHLKELMNTASAKKIAVRRHAYTEQFLKQFLTEWDGKR